MGELLKFFNRHPLLAERAAMALCARIVLPADCSPWADFNLRTKADWSGFKDRGPDWKPSQITVREHRRPPLPGNRRVHGRFPDNHCPVCCQPTFEGGDWRDSAGRPRWNKSWHECCLVAHNTWTRYADLAFRLAVQQGGRCPITKERILNLDGLVMAGVQVDHIVPLWRIAVDAHLYQWPDVLRFWGLGNLQALSTSGHRAKNAKEAKERASLARVAVMAGQPVLEL